MDNLNKRVIIPKKVIEDFQRYGVIGFGEIHGVKEIYEIYENVINQLPKIPNLAFEIKKSESIEFEKLLKNEKAEFSKFSLDGRVTQELLDFIKKYRVKNPEIKIIYFDEDDTVKNQEKHISRDEEMSSNILKQLYIPLVIISGNSHLQKELIRREFGGKLIEFLPMGYYLKEKIGDFPVLNFNPISGSYYNFKEVKLGDIDKKPILNEFLERKNNSYFYFFENSSPARPLKSFS